ncbi:MAG: thioredoxin family protein [Ignavibacteriae bacterium]|nr:MAG: thioredoxin family protein [Ignavibacteriota bacterium]
MKTRFIAVFILFAVLTAAVRTLPSVKKVENFTLQDYNGTQHSLKDFSSSKAIVLMFIATLCPVSNAYNERMEALVKEYSARHIAFIGINSNAQESAEDVKAHAKEHGFSFPILKDRNNVVADNVSASVTPEIFVLNGKLDVLYHGRIDDSRRVSDVKSEDLRNALNAILSGKPVPVTETKAFGCSIKRIK